MRPAAVPLPLSLLFLLSLSPPVLAQRRATLPPIPVVEGPLRINVVYPDSTVLVDVLDSSFVFGSVGTGAAKLRINGDPVKVAPNGAWLAWIPFRGDSIITLRLEATTGAESARLDYRIRRVARFAPKDPRGLWVDTTSFQPAGRVWWPGDEFLPLSVRASDGAALTLLLPGGARIPLGADRDVDPVPEGLRAFDRDTLKLTRFTRATRYSGAVRGVALGDPGPLFGAPGGKPGGEATLLAVRGKDTLRVRWPLRMALLDSAPILTELDHDRLRRGLSDAITVGRASPAATYTWFFPGGTRARVTGRINSDLRIALGNGGAAWVSATEAYPLVGGNSAPVVVGSVTLSPGLDRVTARIPVGARIPFQVEESERALTLVLYGAVSDVNWLRYGAADTLVSLATARQAGDELRLSFELSAPVWGYRTRWNGTDLILEIRRPPQINRTAPLRGRLIVIDAGHPPGGGTGPTGLTEAEANLGISQELRQLLTAQGARVIMTRTGPGALELGARPRMADSLNADLLVSIHNNAFPEGVNPFTNNGSSAFYNHPPALPLARDIQARLVAHLGLRDLGVGRGDLALARPTWMPAVLTEGLFLMIPEQEAALRSDAGRREYALAVSEGIKQFLTRRAAGKW